jgi:hypothetical protein
MRERTKQYIGHGIKLDDYLAAAIRVVHGGRTGEVCGESGRLRLENLRDDIQGLRATVEGASAITIRAVDAAEQGRDLLKTVRLEIRKRFAHTLITVVVGMLVGGFVYGGGVPLSGDGVVRFLGVATMIGVGLEVVYLAF